MRLFRRRFIPNETVELVNDEVIFRSESMIITRWRTLKPRRDFAHGLSCYYIDKNIKISNFYTDEDKLRYHYCDIIHTNYDPDQDSYIFEDLLVDVVIHPGGTVEVLDVGELDEAYRKGLIDIEQLLKALRVLDELLAIVYGKELGHLLEPLEAQRKGC